MTITKKRRYLRKPCPECNLFMDYQEEPSPRWHCENCEVFFTPAEVVELTRPPEVRAVHG
jgi:ribosomal protein S27AE